MVGRIPEVSYKTVYDVLLPLPVFDSNQRPVSKDDPVWDDALKLLNYKITKKNLQQRFYGNRLKLQDNLKNEKYPKSIDKKPESPADKEVLSSPKIDALINLNQLMADVSMKPIMKGFSPKPFYMIYSLPDQVGLYKDFMKKSNNSVFLSIYPEFIEKTYIYNRECKNVLVLSLSGATTNGDIIPFFQGLSESIDRDFMSLFIGEFLKQRDNPVPRQCYMSCSLDVIEGLCVMLNHQNIEDYSIQCFQYLTCSKEDLKKKLFKLPVCSLHLDVQKTMQYVDVLMDNTMSVEDVFVKNFYYDCIFYLCHVEDFDVFKNFIHNLFTVLYKRYFDRETENAREFILAVIDSEAFKNMKQEYGASSEKTEVDVSEFLKTVEDEQYLNNEVYIFFKKMQLIISEKKRADTEEKKVLSETISDISNDNISEENGAESSEEDLDINPYRKLLFLSSLTKFLTFCPLWTSLIPHKKVSLKLYNYLNRNQYQELYGKVYGDNRQLQSADEFIQNHVQFLIQKVEAGREIIRTLNVDSDKSGPAVSSTSETNNKDICGSEESPTTTLETITYSFLGYCENWMNKASNRTDIKNEEPDDDLDHTSLEFEQELSYFKNMLDQSVVDNDHDYCANTVIMDIESSKENVQNQKTVQPKIGDESQVEATNSEVKPAEYLNPCPHLDLMYNKPNASGYRDPVIENGNKKLPRSHKCKKYKLESTSAFDTVVEVFKQAMKNYQDFYNYCEKATITDKAKESFLKIVIQYVQDSNIKKFNTNRFHYLLKNGITIGDRIFCDDELIPFFDKLMATKFGITQIKICSKCHIVTEYSNKNFVNVPANEILKSTQLENLLEKELNLEKVTSQKCKACQNFILELFDAQDYLAISVDENSLSIENIEEHVVVQGKRFTLAGLIERVPTQIALGQTHFVAYCRFIRGNWQKRDNQAKDILKVDCKKKTSCSPCNICSNYKQFYARMTSKLFS